MPPPINHLPQDINRTTIQPRPQSVAFSYLLTHERICAELTKVNNSIISDLLSVNCKTTILQLVKPAISVVNKINPLLNLFCFAGGGAELYLCSLMINKDIHIGVLGGGQLGGMLIRHAIDFGLYIKVLDSSADATCARYTNNFVLGDTLDYDAVRAFGKGLDIITIEKEAVNVDALEDLAKQGVQVHPSPAVIRIVQDKYSQKDFLQQHGIPVSPGILIKDKKELNKYKDRLPAVLKLCRDGYDGKGVMMLKTEADFDKAFDAPCVLEDLVAIRKELAVIVSRNAQGEIRCYDPVEMVFNKQLNLLDYQLAPAEITDRNAAQARDLAIRTAEALNLVGIMAVEMFLTIDDEVLVNELAPRPHNSGHHTIEACVTSQYEQLLRAIMGMPPGDTTAHKKSVMINILEPAEGNKGQLDRTFKAVLDTKDAHLHWYGKKNSKEGRKVGHITVNGDSISEAVSKAEAIRNHAK